MKRLRSQKMKRLRSQRMICVLCLCVSAGFTAWFFYDQQKTGDDFYERRETFASDPLGWLVNYPFVWMPPIILLIKFFQIQAKLGNLRDIGPFDRTGIQFDPIKYPPGKPIGSPKSQKSPERGTGDNSLDHINVRKTKPEPRKPKEDSEGHIS